MINVRHVIDSHTISGDPQRPPTLDDGALGQSTGAALARLDPAEDAPEIWEQRFLAGQDPDPFGPGGPWE